jgi:hypothetical protein
VFKTKVTRLEKGTVAWESEANKVIELVGFYLSSALELAAEFDSLLGSIGQQCEENITRCMNRNLKI